MCLSKSPRTSDNPKNALEVFDKLPTEVRAVKGEYMRAGEKPIVE